MNSAEILNTENLEANVVVIGGGGAGLTAAVAAAEKRASVILLEKRRTVGGDSALAVGIFAADSPVQQKMMVYAPKDELFKFAMDYAHWAINPRLVRTFINKSGSTIGWLEEKGVGFEDVWPARRNLIYRTAHNIKGQGSGLIKVLLKNCKDLGVKLYSQTATKRILTDKKGKVTGVLAAAKEKELRITAKSVIIATGGYGGNKELLKKYYHSPENMYNVGLPLKGDGLLMATEIGAATEGLGIVHLYGPFVPKSLTYTDRQEDKYRPSIHLLTYIAREPNIMWVNKYGERFMDEGQGSVFPELGKAMERQPDKISYQLFDEEIKQKWIKEGFFFPSPYVSPRINLEKAIQIQADKGRIKISDDWGEIARWMGLDPQVLNANIDQYNSFCDQGYDEMFVKDRRFLQPLRTPPYYAIKCHLGYLGTIGGIKINERTEVINHQDNPIPGLYAAGVATGGWESSTYNMYLCGHTFGFSIYSGRIAGENAAEYALRK
jgi:fumarate reductase flavoprotein subunit